MIVAVECWKLRDFLVSPGPPDRLNHFSRSHLAYASQSVNWGVLNVILLNLAQLLMALAVILVQSARLISLLVHLVIQALLP